MKRDNLWKTWFLAGLMTAMLSGCESSPPRQAGARPAGAPAIHVAALERVAEPSHVCMVNDIYMGRTQIPIEVGGRTYFGCCPNCKDRLEKEPAVRAATDPVTGEVVDKASAVMARDPGGHILYFASEATYGRYSARR